MSGRSSQTKGRRAELELCDYLKQRGYNAVPGEAQSYGKTPDIYGLDRLHVECKRHERLALDAWMAQSETDAARFGDGCPVVIYRKNRQPWHIVMKLEDFLQFYNIPQKSAECERGEYK